MCKFTSIFVVATTDTAAHRVPNDGEKKKFAAKHEARIETETKRKEKELNICVYFYNNIEQIVGAYV